MPVARFQFPDGRIGRFEVPEGTTPEDAQAMVGNFVQQGMAKPSVASSIVDLFRHPPDFAKPPPATYDTTGQTNTEGPVETVAGAAEAVAGPVAQFAAAPVALASGIEKAAPNVGGSRVAGALINYYTKRLGQKFMEGTQRVMKPVEEITAPQTKTGQSLTDAMGKIFDFLPEQAGERTFQATGSPLAATAAKTGAYGLELLAPFLRRSKTAVEATPREAVDQVPPEKFPGTPSAVAEQMKAVRPLEDTVKTAVQASQEARAGTGTPPTPMEQAFATAKPIDKSTVTVESASRETGLDKAKTSPQRSDVSMLARSAKAWAKELPNLPSRTYEELAKIPSSKLGAEQEAKLQEVRARIFESGETTETAMRAVWGPEFADAPPELRSALERGLALPETSSGVTPTGKIDVSQKPPVDLAKQVAATPRDPEIGYELGHVGVGDPVVVKSTEGVKQGIVTAKTPTDSPVNPFTYQVKLADGSEIRNIRHDDISPTTELIQARRAADISDAQPVWGKPEQEPQPTVDLAISGAAETINKGPTDTSPQPEIVKPVASGAVTETPKSYGDPKSGSGITLTANTVPGEGPWRVTTWLDGKPVRHVAAEDYAKADTEFQSAVQAEKKFSESGKGTFPTHDQRKVVGLGVGAKPELKPIIEDLGKRINSTVIGRKSFDLIKAGVSDIQKGFAPMAEGSPRARAVAKDWANADRLARWQWGQFDELLKKNYTEEELGNMWRAADEENVLRMTGKKVAGQGGIDALPADQRATVEALHQYGEELLKRTKAVDMFQGEGLPYWAPRMAVIIGEDGEIIRPKPEVEGGTVGRNITTNAPSLKHRKYLTKEETEAAMKEKFGEGAKLVENIRTMPMAMARLERAIAGRELINNIKEIGKQVGEELTSESDNPGFFTVDHPAFKTYRPRLSRVGDVEVQTNKFEVVKDANGDPIFDKVPLYVSKEFEGPLKSIMSEKSGAVYGGLMNLKGKTMSIIMYSPVIHNAVEYGRALPASPGKMLTFRMYRDGGAAMRNPAVMRQAITDGMVPIGHRFAYQDISGLMEEPTLKPGRSTTAKVAGAITDVVSKEAGKKVRTAIDKAGDVYHNTLLWDQVAKLQAGLYVNIKADFKARLIKGGLDPVKAEAVAGKVAAHFANRYAGAIPNEAMSQWARKSANILLFSRSFTVGNIGAMKDAMTGLPRDVQAQIMRDLGEIEGKQVIGAVTSDVKSLARRKAIAIIMMDIAFGIAGNSILQDTLDNLKRDKSLDEIGQGYANRLDALVKRAKESPLEVLNPIGDLESLSSTSENEPGKENRVLWGYDDKGTAIYVRLPTGKIGEEFSAYLDLLTGKADILLRKESTVLRPAQQAIFNDVGFGRHLYDPDAKGVEASMKRLGTITWNFMSQQTPTESIKGAARIVEGKGDNVDFYKVIGPFFGLTYSKGAPGGPAVGEMFKVDRQHRQEIINVMPDVKQLIEDGDQAGAIEKMKEAHMAPWEIRTTLKYALHPGARISPRRMKQFQQVAPDEEKQRLNRFLNH